jgi:Tfp pilus assembly protein PilO
MILDKLAKLDEHKRAPAAVLVILAAACVCYFAITRNSVVKLQTAKANYADAQTAYANAENQQARLSDLLKQLEKKEELFQNYRQQYFSAAQAAKFFENINAAAIACNLKPLSRIISEPKEFASDKEAGQKNKLLKMQSAKVTVFGNYFDIIDFMDELAGRPQKVSLTNLYLTLPTKDDSHPKASFEIILIIDSSKDIKK